MLRGKILFLGGDQVYPTASREAYDDRFIGPFEEAYHPLGGTQQWKRGAQDLYAIPGNHDWYDGLNSFFGLFCRRRVKPSLGIGFNRDGRVIAGRQTHQTRSYFAVQLPGKWWLWGTDSQLAGYIDQPQIDYFRHVARYWMEPGSKLILCIGQPSWAYVDPNDPKPAFDNFSYLERLAEAEVDDQKNSMGHQLKLVLTGDSHHYSRFTEDDRHYITCGGGGAFLHPTHHLKNKAFQWEFPPPGEPYRRGTSYRRAFQMATSQSGEEALYPSRSRSRLLTFWNLAFAGINHWFTLTLAITYFLFHWVLDFNARLMVRGPLGTAQHEVGSRSLGTSLRDGSLGDSMIAYWNLALVSPSAAILILIALGGYYYAADAPHGWKRLLMGGGHALAQAVVVTATTCFVIRTLPDMATGWEILAAAIVAAVVSATTYGLYLLTSLLVFKRHWNEGFSSFAHRGYKSMLRMKISRDGKLAVYPIGLDRVPSDRRNSSRNSQLNPHLIEGPVIIS